MVQRGVDCRQLGALADDEGDLALEGQELAVRGRTSGSPDIASDDGGFRKYDGTSGIAAPRSATRLR